MTEYCTYDTILVLLNEAEKKGEAMRDFKGYGKAGIEFKVKIKREGEQIEVHIDDKLRKVCKTEGAVIDVIDNKLAEW